MFLVGIPLWYVGDLRWFVSCQLLKESFHFSCFLVIEIEVFFGVFLDATEVSNDDWNGNGEDADGDAEHTRCHNFHPCWYANHDVSINYRINEDGSLIRAEVGSRIFDN